MLERIASASKSISSSSAAGTFVGSLISNSSSDCSLR
jgi:hypothetical protein